MSDRSACPACGQPVYPTDDVCMSCGAKLHEGPPAAQPADARSAPTAVAPGPVPPPRPERPPLVTPWFRTVVESCGRLWDIYPWIGIALLLMIYPAVSLHVPGAIFLLIVCLYGLWEALLLFWVITDVLYYESDWWWVLVAFVCYPFGLVLYLIKGR